MSATIQSQLTAVGAEIDRAFAEQARTIRELGEELAKTKQERDRYHQQAIRATSELKKLRERFEDAPTEPPAVRVTSDAALFVRAVQVGDVLREEGTRYEYTVEAVSPLCVRTLMRGELFGGARFEKGKSITPHWDAAMRDASTGERVYMPWEARAANGNDEGRSAAE